MFKVTTSNFEYEPASPGLGETPSYLVTPRNPEGMSIELHHTKTHRSDRFKDQVGQTINVGENAWHLTEYDRDDEAMDTMWFRNFADADAHAFGLWTSSYDHEAIAAGREDV